MPNLTKLQIRAVAIIAAAVLILILVIFGYWALSRAAREKALATEAHGTAIVAKGDSAASAAATSAVAGYGERQGERQQLDEENRRDIQDQPHAADAIDSGVNDAGLRSLCKRAAYRDTQQCSRLRNAGPAAAPQAGGRR